jgi:exosortase
MREKSGSTQSRLRHACFLGLLAAFAGVFHHALWTVVGSSLSVDKYSHILLVAPVSALLLYQERGRVLAQVAYSKAGAGLLLLTSAVLGFASAQASALSESGYLSLSFLLLVCCSLSAFLLCYGGAAFRAGLFPLLFLILLVPLPDAILERCIAVLQNGSAAAACGLFRLAHIPYARHGVVLELPRINIYVAEECSGIRSSLVLFLSSLVLGHLFLKSGWSKALLTLAVLPVTIAKNGLRIFVLSTLGMYVNPSFLSGRLHHQGGFIFFGLAFGSLLFLIWLLQKLGIEQPGMPRPESAAPSAKEIAEKLQAAAVSGKG